MQKHFDVNQLRVAKPCTAAWSEMKGDGQRRFCESCKKNVYTVAGMSEREVRELVSKSEILPCMRLARRADGTVITRDCPVGVARLRQKVALAALAFVAFGFTVVAVFATRERKRYDTESMTDLLRSKPVVGPVVDKLFPPNPFMLLPGEVAMGGTVILGEIAPITTSSSSSPFTPGWKIDVQPVLEDKPLGMPE